MSGYQALREAAAWLDLDGRGRFRVAGEDRARLLHAMTTNHIQQLAATASCYAFFLSDKGRILGDANILNLGDTLLIDTEAASHDALFQHLDKYIIADDVTLEDAREKTTVIGLEGPHASALRGELAQFTVADCSATGIGLRVFAPRAEKQALIDRLEQLGAVAASPDDQNIVRLERFRPVYGLDFSDKHLVHETQLLHAVHFNKGCYLGQEIVERVRSRGQVHRLLVPLYVDSAVAPPTGSAVTAGETAAGETMSSAYSPALGKSIAFAILRSDCATPGTKLSIGATAAEVAAAKGA
ncbi:MAG: folate-binding protein YgfZ [Bryobacterales bacterium]|nr:folate-binding protein YgfZ [Bryobacterales bacterium]